MESLVQFLPLLLIIGVLYMLIRYTRRRPASPPVGTQSAFSRRVIRFGNPANGYEEAVGTPWIWCLLFGCVYFAAKGIWTHAVAALLLGAVAPAAILYHIQNVVNIVKEGGLMTTKKTRRENTPKETII